MCVYIYVSVFIHHRPIITSKVIYDKYLIIKASYK